MRRAQDSRGDNDGYVQQINMARYNPFATATTRRNRPGWTVLRNPQTGQFRVQEVGGEPEGTFEKAMNQALIKKMKKKVTVDLALQSAALLALIVLAAWLSFTSGGGLEVIGEIGKEQDKNGGEEEQQVSCGTALKVWYALYFLLAFVRFYVALYSAARYRRFQ